MRQYVRSNSIDTGQTASEIITERIVKHVKICLFQELSRVQMFKTTAPGCSKLRMLLVNISLKFQMLISNTCQYFLLKKCEKLLHCKSFSHFFNKKYQCIG